MARGENNKFEEFTEFLHEHFCGAWGLGGSILCSDCPDKAFCDKLDEVMKRGGD